MSLLDRLERMDSARRQGSVAAPEAPPVEKKDSEPVVAATVEKAPVRQIADTGDSFYLVKHAIMDSVLSMIDPKMADDSNATQLRARLENLTTDALEKNGFQVTREMRGNLINEFIDEVHGLGPLEVLLSDSSVTKVTVNHFNEILVERFGKLEPSGKLFRDNDHLMSLIRKVATLLDTRIDSKVPLMDKLLPGEGKVRAKVPPIATSGPTITIDKGGVTNVNPFNILKRHKQEQQPGGIGPFIALKQRIQARLAQELDEEAVMQGKRDVLRTQVEQLVAQAINEEGIAVSRTERSEIIGDLFNEIVGLGPIEPLINDSEVSEVMVNGPNYIYVERHGAVHLTDRRFRDDQHVLQVCDRIVAPLGRRIDEKMPYVDARLPDGSRVNIIIPPLTLNGPVITIRKFRKEAFTISDMISTGTLTREAAEFLQAAVQARMNIIVSGGTGSGKTTTLNILSSFIPHDERIVTVEDTAELQLRQEHVVRLEARPPNIENQGEVTIRDLVRNALRMRPDRIVVGEVRSAEALDMLQAMNTGHDGSLTTIHANSPREMLGRLETLVLMAGMDLPVRAIRDQIAGAVQVIVHQARMRDHTRKITHISEITGMEGDVITMQSLFVFKQESINEVGKIVGKLAATGLRPKCYDRIAEMGINLPLSLFKGPTQ